MKTSVLIDEMRLAEVRPDQVSKRYEELRRAEAAHLLQNPSTRWVGRANPTRSCKPEPAFMSDGLSFHHCPDSGSLFASPVPVQDELDRLARDGEAARWRRDYFGHRFSEKQRQSIHAPIVRWAQEVIDEYGLEAPRTALVGNDETGLASSLSAMGRLGEMVLTERVSGQPAPEGTVERPVAELGAASFDLVFDMGSLERVSDPERRFALWSELVTPGGFLAFTTSMASGLEYRVLGPKAASFIALDRLTLYSVPALMEQLAAHGFEVVEFSTPGRLDVEVLTQAFADGAPADNPLDFWTHALKHGGEDFKTDLQRLLQRHRFSSFARVLARRVT
ncbi:hypothetical protein [Maricaulis sp.]|uniref:hypothetical protein n=1 Tax=Maricaulis sp. TaxID=1486257 RepID=UPI003A8D1035